MSVKFTDNSMQCKNLIDNAVYKFLEESSGYVESEVKRNTRVDTGQLKASWTHFIDDEEGSAYIGSPLENAIWEEYGTGIQAENGDGRKTGWVYTYYGNKMEKGRHFTRGKHKNPKGLRVSFNDCKSLIMKYAEIAFKEELK